MLVGSTDYRHALRCDHFDFGKHAGVGAQRKAR
jgi:hypothetical protein